MSKHTPGPWKNTTPDELAIVATNIFGVTFDVAQVTERRDDYDVSLANTAIIMASPAMLEALESILAAKDMVVLPDYCWDRIESAHAIAKGDASWTSDR